MVAGILGAAALTAASAYAQTAPAGTQAAAAGPQNAQTVGSAQTSQSLQEVVVTATAAQTTKLDASYNVVTADDELIKESNPLSAADILKIAPGVWLESSGGETGLNVEVAGFPSGGDTPFFTTMIMGMPVYGSPMLSYMDTASFIRLDDTVQRLEVVQGGPAAVFGPGQIGGTGNYLLKTGDTSPGGTVSATYGTEGAWRGGMLTTASLSPMGGMGASEALPGVGRHPKLAVPSGYRRPVHGHAEARPRRRLRHVLGTRAR